MLLVRTCPQGSFLPANSAHHRERGKVRAADTEEIIILKINKIYACYFEIVSFLLQLTEQIS